MKTYARIQSGAVAELLSLAVDPATLFNPALQWQEAPPGVEIGWLVTATGFTAPPPPSPLLAPSLAQLQAELAALTAQLQALTATPHS